MAAGSLFGWRKDCPCCDGTVMYRLGLGRFECSKCEYHLSEAQAMEVEDQLHYQRHPELRNIRR